MPLSGQKSKRKASKSQMAVKQECGAQQTRNRRSASCRCTASRSRAPKTASKSKRQSNKIATKQAGERRKAARCPRLERGARTRGRARLGARFPRPHKRVCEAHAHASPHVRRNLRPPVRAAVRPQAGRGRGLRRGDPRLRRAQGGAGGGVCERSERIAPPAPPGARSAQPRWSPGASPGPSRPAAVSVAAGGGCYAFSFSNSPMNATSACTPSMGMAL